MVAGISSRVKVTLLWSRVAGGSGPARRNGGDPCLVRWGDALAPSGHPHGLDALRRLARRNDIVLLWQSE